MLLQIVPINRLVHPIWESASAALQQPLPGSISIDTGATVLSLSRYLSIAGIVLLATAIGTDRKRAEWLLSLLTATTVVLAALLIGGTLGLIHFLTGFDGSARVAALDGATLGVILSAAGASVPGKDTKVDARPSW